jgi:predicted AAA+ superfamily ATPase
VGKCGDREIDVVGLRQNDRVYVPTTYQLGLDKALIDREFGILLDTKDNYPKYVVSLDESWSGNIAGVKWLNLADFLLLDEY